MKFTIITYGSWGDVVPYIALGQGLANAGFGIRMITHDTYRERIESCGMEFRYGCADARKLMESSDGRKWLKESPLKAMMNMSDLIEPYLTEITQLTFEAAKGSDLIIFSIVGGLTAHDIAEALKVPAIGAYVTPLTPTDNFRYPMFYINSPLNLPLLNRLTYKIPNRLISLAFYGAVQNNRERVLGLPRLQRRKFRVWDGAVETEPIIYGISPNICPNQPDWGEWIHSAGYWFPDFDEDWQPDNRIIDFLESGKKPIYIGFGSMNSDEPEKMAEIFVKALRKSRNRGILSRGWGALAGIKEDDDIIMIDYVPHKWLFPKVSAVVHHGGSGTTAQGFRAGIPQIIVPFAADQFYWAKVVQNLGVGPKASKAQKVDSAEMISLMKLIEKNKDYRQNARSIGCKIESEVGIGKAVDYFRNLTEKMQ